MIDQQDMLDEYHEAMRRHREHQELTRATKEAAKSGAVWGGLGIAATQLVNGNRSLRNVLLRGLGGSALASAAAAGATNLGGRLAGSPSDDDPAGYARRGALGGAVGGGLVGGGVGYLLGSGRLRWMKSLPLAGHVGKFAMKEFGPETGGPLNNLGTDAIRKAIREPTHGAGLKAAAMLGIGGAAVGAHTGLDEGMGVDLMRNIERQEMERARRKLEMEGGF